MYLRIESITYQAPIKAFKKSFIAILVEIHNIGWIVEL